MLKRIDEKESRSFAGTKVVVLPQSFGLDAVGFE